MKTINILLITILLSAGKGFSNNLNQFPDEAKITLENQDLSIHDIELVTKSNDLSSMYFQRALTVANSLQDDQDLFEVVYLQEYFVENLENAMKYNKIILHLDPSNQKANALSREISDYLLHEE